ncbi:MAG TPA: hypothetical protein VIX84_05690, partial [Acidimicrobiales bacterium]
DTGPVYARRAVPIGDETTLHALQTQLVAIGTELLVGSLATGVDGLPTPEPQVGEPTIAAKITPEDLHLDWTRPARELLRTVRLGGAWTTFRGKRLTVLDATVDDTHGGTGDEHAPGAIVGVAVATREGALVLGRVQPESRSPMSAEEWLRGVRPRNGERLGTD